MTASPPPQATLWALLVGNFIIGTGVLLPAGLLGPITRDLGVTSAEAGWLMTLGGLVVGLGAPVVAGLTARVDRRLLLTVALVAYVLGHLGAMMAPGLGWLLVMRALSVAGAAAFTPQAAATVGLLVPPASRGAAIGFIFIGWSLASVVGIPLATFAGEGLGWRATYGMMAFVSLLAAGMVWVVVPRGLRVSPMSFGVWGQVLRDVRLVVVLCITAAAMAGQFTVFTYISPILSGVHGLSGTGTALAFCLAGAFGVFGNWYAARRVSVWGVNRTVMGSLCLIGGGLAVAGVGWGSLGAFVAGLCLWNLGAFAVNSMQQARLVGLAPMLASVTIALNTSFVYLGQAIGSATGGVLIAQTGPSARQMAVAVGFVSLAAALSWFAARLERLAPQP